jgi:hypothetical protein
LNEKEAVIKRAYHKSRLIIGLVMIMLLSLLWGESDAFSPKFTYSYQIPGFTAIFSTTPKGFTPRYEQTENPISVNFPKWFRNIKMQQSVSDSGNMLIISEKMDGKDMYSPRYMPFSEYFLYKKMYDLDNIWYERVALTDSSFFLNPLDQQRGGQSLEIIGADIAGQRVALRIRGTISITGKYNQQKNSIMATGNMDNEQKNFLMDQTQQFTIEGTIGDRITISIDEDSERDFEFENAIKINYKGKEDEIIQSANFGNIGLSLPGTQFVTGSSSSSGLFGGKALMKLGPIDVTAIASYEKKDSKKKSWGGGSDNGGGSTVQIFDYEYKRNTYFFLDDVYRDNLYPFNHQSSAWNAPPGGEITYFDLYISCNEREDERINAVAFVDIASDGTPQVVTEHPEEDVADTIYFRRLTPTTADSYGEYTLNAQLGYIKMGTGLGDDNILAVAYRTSNGLEYGDINTGQYLKIIKAENPKPSYVTWDLEMKNVYDLKARNIDQDGFDLKIFINDNNPRQLYEGEPYIKYFGLDNYNQSGSYNSPDGKIDLKPEGVFVDLEAGELWIPYARPFEAPPEGVQSVEGIYNDHLGAPDDPNLPSADKIYTSSYTDPERKEKKYYIEATYTNRSSTIELGEMFIIEGSEEILINGKKMTKGVDYDIDYFSGMITLKSAEAMDPDAKIDINYETEQLFGGIGEQKLMAGMRAEYRINENAFLGATAMYYDRSVLDDKNVNIGDEPFRNFIWDINGELEYDLNWLDRAMNALPFVHIRQASHMKVSAEVAQILPNPNTIDNEESGDFNGVAKLDDFESANQETPMNINFQKWTHASKPVNTFFASSFKERGFMFWYNPFTINTQGTKIFGIRTNYIWPNKETTQSNEYTNILSVVLDPEVNGITGHETQSDVRQVWGGIMQPVYLYDQSKSKYIELWVKGEKGQLQIDIGEISEDWYDINYDVSKPEEGDGEKNYEDKDLNGTLQITADYTEDTGINGLTDEEELARGWDPMIDNFDKDGYENGEVRHCNGSEDNGGDKGIQPYPESEDIDRDGKLDQTNSYYSYTLDLSSDEWLESSTKFTNGKKTGWKQYRIPLTAMVDSVGKPSFQSIRMMRLNVFGVADQDTVHFAGVSIVGNEWQELGLANEGSSYYTVDDDRFSISVKNTDENADYVSPPGITGNKSVDPLGGETITEKEQSLVLRIDGLQPGETALAEKIMLENETLLMYKKLKMFVHGDTEFATDSFTPIDLFLRIGRGDMSEYYEVVTPVYPDWDERNNIEMVFDEITQLKNMVDFDNIEFFAYKENNKDVREYRPIDEGTGDYTGKIYRVVGNPSLSRIERMRLGVINNDKTESKNGEIWVNEMRVVESNNDPGMAMRGSFDFRLGGLVKFNINGKKTDADFRQVNQQMSSNLSTSENFNINATINANRLFPDKWRVKFPITMSQSQATTTPKYYPGSDILLGENPDDSLKVISKRQSFATSLGRSGSDNDPLLTQLLINPVSASVNASRSESSSLEMASKENTSLTGQFQYSLSLDKGEGIRYLSWIPFLSEKLREDKFYWKPTSFDWKLNVSKRDEDRVSRATMDTSNTFSFGMTKSMNLAFNPFNTLRINYVRSSSSDLADYKDDVWGIFNDITYDSLMNGTNVGDVTQMKENLGVNYSPDITNWLKPKFTYNSNYTYRAQKDQYYAGTGVARKYTFDLSLNPKQIWDSIAKDLEKSRSNRKKKEITPLAAKEQRPVDKEGGMEKPPAKNSRIQSAPQPKGQTERSSRRTLPRKTISMSELMGRINAIRFNYSDNLTKTNNGITGQDTVKIYKYVRYKYRYGFGDYFYLPTGSFEGSISNPNKNEHTQNMTISSGVRLTRSISITFNYKQTTTAGPRYQFKTSTDEYYDDLSNIIANGDTLELITSDSSSSRGYFPLGETGQEGFAFPDYRISWQITPSQYKWLNGKLDFIQKITIQHNMSGKESTRYKLRTDTHPYYMESSSSTYTLNFTPLVKANITFKGDFRADIGYNKTIKIDHQGDAELDYENTSIVRNYQDNMTLNVSYNYNKGISIPVPFLKKIKVLNMKNEISFSLQGKYGLNKKIVKNKGDLEFGAPKDHRINWEVEPRVKYRFSKNIDGSLFFKYGQRIDMNQQNMDGENKFDDYKDFGITVTIRISG